MQNKTTCWCVGVVGVFYFTSNIIFVYVVGWRLNLKCDYRRGRWRKRPKDETLVLDWLTSIIDWCNGTRYPAAPPRHPGRPRLPAGAPISHAPYDGVSYYRTLLFRQAIFWHRLPRLTCQIFWLKDKLLDISIPKQQFEKQNANCQYWRVNTHPCQNFSTFGRSKSQRSYGHIGFACKLLLKRSTVKHVKDSNFSVCKRHSLCIGDAIFLKI